MHNLSSLLLFCYVECFGNMVCDEKAVGGCSIHETVFSMSYQLHLGKYIVLHNVFYLLRLGRKNWFWFHLFVPVCLKLVCIVWM